MSILAMVASLTQLVKWLIVAQALAGWFRGVPALVPAVRALARVTAPLLDPIRRRVPPIWGLDLSPWIAILLITAGEFVLFGALNGH